MCIAKESLPLYKLKMEVCSLASIISSSFKKVHNDGALNLVSWHPSREKLHVPNWMEVVLVILVILVWVV